MKMFWVLPQKFQLSIDDASISTIDPNFKRKMVLPKKKKVVI
jgi:hypothetical protein